MEKAESILGYENDGKLDRGCVQFTYRQLTFSNSTFCPHSLFLCVLCGSQNKQRLFPYTALTDWFL